MFSLTAFLNKLLICRYKNYFKKYQRASQSIERVQSDKLKSYINKNAHTVFGRDHNFYSIKNYQSFIKNVPLTEYEDYKSYLDKIKTGQSQSDRCRFKQAARSSHQDGLAPGSPITSAC